MQNDQGECVDLYIPRKCSASNRIIHAKDHASIGLAFAELDDQGHVTGTNKTINICGEIRKMGESDDSINREINDECYKLIKEMSFKSLVRDFKFIQ